MNFINLFGDYYWFLGKGGYRGDDNGETIGEGLVIFDVGGDGNVEGCSKFLNIEEMLSPDSPPYEIFYVISVKAYFDFFVTDFIELKFIRIYSYFNFFSYYYFCLFLYFSFINISPKLSSETSIKSSTATELF